MTKIAKTKEKDGDTMRSVGRRKTASARVRLSPGTGKITVNGKALEVYFPYFEWQNIVKAPLTAVNKEKTFDVSAKIVGGGQKGQATAVQLGIARALVVWNDELKKSLKTQGYLTRDARVKERKKPGLKRARRAPQWSKR
ncbi:MAG: 30S ribosomal protein S9 [Candidatus Magasanikbacteria bacterium GW2011_GWA2_40_10]|uniref:Small ribosomal subunit protein uS9 n=1 Tax=Candidatus Magasanikbacteria bacterium GW2011_GWA2_40_10 TaxID=1619037 RepID=A0A0G0T9V4_9BACT|nr:MAG: 30S ribosomal protein S9 [Candidatus Magasanikbacteria bacterium GW2011_GWA2_40_10]